ncbi:ATP-binding protein [Roseiconus lacunae]|uniref:ATP-binding protein n=1 Tax=Roseiconus lacunae TaxID=2605694 RepID=UPI001E56F330|nr:ATP-binding protein [Roseiconus lacunae]MCD0460039.1 ATP-binding protein [Roseiconus lacunae]
MAVENLGQILRSSHPPGVGSPVRQADDSRQADPQRTLTALERLERSVGRRYSGCAFENFRILTDRHSKAVAACREYAAEFRDHVRDGVSLLLLGPRGTGKDHLMVATLKAIVQGYSIRRAGAVVYRDGLSMYSHFRSHLKDEDQLVSHLLKVDLLAISDLLPPTGPLSEYEQRILIRVIDGRYRECRPIAATLNVTKFGELESRIGPQAADRLRDGAKVVPCIWESYRAINAET